MSNVKVQTSQIIEERLREGVQVHQRMIEELVPQIGKAAEMIIKCYQRGGKLLIFGNGGSAADAQHIAGELMNYFRYPRPSLPALALHTDTSLLTAISNDLGYAHIFEKQIRALGKEGDVALVITTSDCEFRGDGHSANIGLGLKAARELGLTTVGLVSAKSQKILDYLDLALQVPSRDTARIQEGHQVAYHIICDLIERTLFPRAVFLDRDGVLCQKAPEGDYIKSKQEFKWLPRAKSALRTLKEAGYLLVVVSNQRGIALGRYSKKDVEKIHQLMQKELLREEGVGFDGFYFCPHDRDVCCCHKPEPGLILKAAEELGIYLKSSVLIGDSKSDVEAGQRAGAKTILLTTREGAEQEGDPHSWPTPPDKIYPNLASAARNLVS